MKSIKVQLSIGLFCLFTVVGIVAAALSFRSARDEAWHFFDQQLQIMAHNVAIRGDSPQTSDAHAPSHDPEDDFVIQVWSGDGQQVRIWPSDATVPKASTLGFYDARTPVGKWRCYTLIREQHTVQISQRFEVRNEFAREAAFWAVAPVLITLPLAWLILTLLINRILGRLDQLGRDLLQGPTLGSLVPTEQIPTEIKPFVLSVNQALTLSHNALVAQRRFIAGAAHGLRTPLAVLQTQLDNLRPPNTSADRTERIDEMERGLRRAILLVQQMLRMARGEAEGQKIEHVDLVAITTASIADLIPLVDHHRHDIGLLRADAARVLADPGDIRMVVDNLLDNAIRYTPAGGVIDISIIADENCSVLEIRDTGPGIADDDQNRVLEPFYRATNERIEGSGLGLSIVAAVTKRCGADLALTNRTDRSGLLVRITFRRIPLQPT